MEKINITFLDFEIYTMVSGLNLLIKDSPKSKKNIIDLKEYIVEQTKLQDSYLRW